MKEILILQQGGDFSPGAAHLGLLFETAPDSPVLRGHTDALTISELLGDPIAIKVKAAVLARQMLANEPPVRGLRQLSIFEEIVIRELQHAYQVLHLHDALVEQGIYKCRFTEPTPFANSLSQLVQTIGSRLRVTLPKVPTALASAGIRRSWQRLKTGEFSTEQWRNELHQLLERLDPYHRRDFTFALRTSPTPKDAYWFYTTAYTFSGIGLQYEPFFDKPFQYLVENPLTGGKPLAEHGRGFFSPYRFAAREMVPSSAELSQAIATINKHIGTIPLHGADVLARAIFQASGFLANFMSRLLPRGLFATCLFQQWVETVQPAALVTGNPVFEGYALQSARRAGIPTLLLQHGILGDFCQFIDPPVDHYLVRGAFWRDFLSPPAARRALVLDLPYQTVRKEQTQRKKDLVLFLTTPYDVQQEFHESDLNDILGTILNSVAVAGGRIAIRVHPLEQIRYYQRKVAILKPNGLTDKAILFSQGPGLEALLEQSAVAVTYASTVFLDCLKYRVPIISFNWHDFSYKQLIAAYGVFNFAQDLEDLKKLLSRGLAGDLPPYVNSIVPFLANTSASDLHDVLARIIHDHHLTTSAALPRPCLIKRNVGVTRCMP